MTDKTTAGYTKKPMNFNDLKGFCNVSWVYLNSEPGLWTVGFYAPDGKWHSESDHSVREEAAQRVAFLNGGQTLTN